MLTQNRKTNSLGRRCKSCSTFRRNTRLCVCFSVCLCEKVRRTVGPILMQRWSDSVSPRCSALTCALVLCSVYAPPALSMSHIVLPGGSFTIAVQIVSGTSAWINQLAACLVHVCRVWVFKCVVVFIEAKIQNQ